MIKIHTLPSAQSRLAIPLSLVTGAKSNKINKISSLDQVLDNIRSDNPLQTFTKRLRTARKESLTSYSKIKEKECPGFVIGDFETRKDAACKIYVPLLGFDIDGIQSEFDTELHLGQCRKSPYIFLAFPSPSGCGLRIFIWCDSTPDNHKEYYKTICNYLSEFLHIKTDKAIRQELKAEGLTADAIIKEIKEREHIDTGTSNVSRIWFYTHVPKELLYLNRDSEAFSLDSPSTEEARPLKPPLSQQPKENTSSLTVVEKIELCKAMADTRDIPAGRNNYIHYLAQLLYEHGIYKNDVLAECLKYQEEGFNDTEITKTVESALKNATFRKFTDEQLKAWKGKVNQQVIEKPPKEESEKPVKKNKFNQIKESLARKYDFRFNIISNEIEYKSKLKEQYEILNENNLIVELMEANFTGVEAPLIALLKSSFVPKYDPFKQYFTTLPVWDESKPDYIYQLANYVKAKDQEWFNLQFKKMLVRSIACALNVIPFNKQCLTLVGKQNDGKTRFLRFLCPPTLKNYIKENLDIHNKDGRLALCQNLFINLDELANFSKYDINKTKAFFTIDQIKERLPYDRKASNYSRRASFLASTNSSEFLTDETGNVRWLVFDIDHIYHDEGGKRGYNQNIDIDLVYSQAYALLQSGFNYKLTSQELEKSESNNRSYQVSSIEQELIQEKYLPGSKDDYHEFLRTSDILKELEQETKSKITVRSVGRAMRILGFEPSQKFYKEYNQQRKGYYVKLIKENV